MKRTLSFSFVLIIAFLFITIFSFTYSKSSQDADVIEIKSNGINWLGYEDGLDLAKKKTKKDFFVFLLKPLSLLQENA